MAVYSDDPNRTLLSGVRVWISGVEVTSRLTSAVQVNTVGRGGHNTCSFTLSNANNGFFLSEDNVNGEWADGGDPGEYGEQIKFALYQFKNNNTVNPVNAETGTRRWPLAVNSPVIHALDPVFVAVRWPYSATERWIPKFKGYIESKPHNADYTKNTRHLSVSCFDIRALMAHMRVQMNYLITNEAGGIAISAESTGEAGTSTGRLNAYDPVVYEGIISDLQLPTNLSTPLAKLTFEETIQLLIVGGTLLKPDVDPGNGAEAAQPGFLERIFNFFGGTSVDPEEEDEGAADGVTRQLAGVADSSDKAYDVKAIGRFKFNLGPVRWPAGTGLTSDDIEIMESWHRLTLFGLENAGDPWTRSQVELHGAECNWEGETAPHAMQLFMLMPSSGSGMSALTEYTQDSGSATRTWSSRKTILEEYLEKIDYQWMVTGDGSISVEFPTYDMIPSQWGEWAEAFTVRHDGEGKSANFDDNRPNVPTIVQATGSYDPSALDGSSELFADALLRGDGLSLTNTRVTLYAPVLAGLLGARVERVSFPFVTDVCRLRQFATLHFQRKLAEASSLSVNMVYRPVFMPNRILHETGYDRYAWVSSVSESFSNQPDHGSPSTSVTLRYVRKLGEDGNYNGILGSANMPLSFNGSGPGINPERGIIITESFAPGTDLDTRTVCPGDTLTGRPASLLGAVAALRSGSSITAADFVPEECSTSEDDLSGTARSLWRKLQAQAKTKYGLDLELICTHNPGDKHEVIDPYGHDENPSNSFDIAITRADGSDGTADDFGAVGALGIELGLAWGGKAPEASKAIEETQQLILERCEYHLARKTPYIWAGHGPDAPDAPGYPGADCAGAVTDCFRYAGIINDRQAFGAGGYRDLFPEVEGRDPLPGELGFYHSGSNPSVSATHVVMVKEKVSDGVFSVYSQSGPGSAATSIEKARANGWHMKLKSSQLYRKDFIGFGAVFDVVAAATGYLNHFSVPEAT